VEVNNLLMRLRLVHKINLRPTMLMLMHLPRMTLLMSVIICMTIVYTIS
jgi:hypothetical protein